jgi:DNA-binding CsgD family transcriptional regulator
MTSNHAVLAAARGTMRGEQAGTPRPGQPGGPCGELAGALPAGQQCCCGEEHLTPRQIDVLCAVASGANTDQAAATLNMSSHTITHHLGDMLRRFGAGNRTELVARAYAAGVLVPWTWPSRRSGRRCVGLPSGKPSGGRP